MGTPRIMVTKNYDLFVPHTINRDFYEGTLNYSRLEASMLKDGWWTREPMVVYPKNAAGKHMIVKGHNRYSIAKRHGLAIYWQIDEQKISLFDGEAPVGRPTWTLQDWLTAHLRLGKNHHYKILNDFMQKTKIHLSSALTLYHFPPSNMNAFRRGELSIPDQSHAEEVGEVVMLATDLQVKFSTRPGFVMAISQIIRTRVVDTPSLMRKMRLNAHLMLKKQFSPNYLAILKDVYNHKSQVHVAIDVLVRNALAEERRKNLIETKKKSKEGKEKVAS